MKHSYIVLTDSGGIQEEAAILGIPIAITRNETERSEVLKLSNSALVGGDRDALKRFILDTQNVKSKNPQFYFKEYGVPGLSEEIVKHLLNL